ncbi:twin-arginine translocation signal domain-containing protein [Actinoplanes sp. N902-109]|uniref:twin-arginine translocation signal domain-containing protein n=1 Tax=Actinoplanes sp. (strain N902-109) TaxID=649831 RepID=UPI0003293CA3|nr:twin-arginine translocation signal domain-containing protein [Actinoplanes sp. N902-109]AGL20433.1 hypothetical protein L083_6923 [Actinoplanes sp. N902-109]
MSPRRLVLVSLWRSYRRVLAWFLGILVVGVTIADLVATRVADPAPGIWMYVANAFRWWLAVIAVVLVTSNLRNYVAGGITRRDFLAGAATLLALAAVAFSIVVPLGHGIEYALHGGSGFSAAIALRDFGHTLPACLAAAVTGAAASAGFYRYGARGGLVLLVPALLPAAVTEALLSTDADGQVETRFLPYAAALLVSLTVTAAVAVLNHRELRDVAIRRSGLG